MQAFPRMALLSALAVAGCSGSSLTGEFGNLDVLVHEQPFHEFDDDDLRMQLQILHLSTRLEDVDIYLERPGAHLSPVQARTTLSSRESFHDLISEGAYVLTLSAVGDPDTPYFVSETFSLDRRTRVALAIRDSAGEDTSEVAVSMFRDRSATLRHRNRETGSVRRRPRRDGSHGQQRTRHVPRHRPKRGAPSDRRGPTFAAA